MKTEEQVREYLRQWRETKTNNDEVTIVKENVIAVIEWILE